MQNATNLHHNDVIRTADGRTGFITTLNGFYSEYCNDEATIAAKVKASLERGNPYATGIARAAMLTADKNFLEQRLAEDARAITIADGETVLIDGSPYTVRVNPRRVSDFVRFEVA